ncbi:hypothetical protein B566_EDAN015574 [Ephemera danica]|nr:hypothetical protein B566_EDAN015574 [Ephemera danica]
MAALVKEAIDFGVNFYDSLIECFFLVPLIVNTHLCSVCLADPRVADWPLMESPVPTVLMVATYLYIVIHLGPKLMANRKPFKLRPVLIVYNAGQVLFSLFMLWEHLMSGWLFHYSYKCQPVDYSHSPTAIRMVHLCWWYYISKLTEFLDTVKRVQQRYVRCITDLRVSTDFLRAAKEGQPSVAAASVPPLANTAGNLVLRQVCRRLLRINVTMDLYLRGFGVGGFLGHACNAAQFTLVFFHSAQVLIFDCSYPKLIAAFLLVHSVIFFALFFDFYQKAYRQQEARKLQQQQQKQLPLSSQLMSLTPAAEGPTPVSDLAPPASDLSVPATDLSAPCSDLQEKQLSPDLEQIKKTQ